MPINPRIKAAKEDFDWESYITLHYDSIKPAHGSNGKELRICCPHPECDDNKHKCYINIDKKYGYFNCFKCDFRTGKEYDLCNFMAYTEDITAAVALMRLMRAYTPTVPTDEDFRALTEDPEAIVGESDTPSYLTSLPDNCVKFDTLAPDSPAVLYARSRGLHEKEWWVANLHFVTKWTEVYNAAGKYKGNLRNRIIIPLYHNRQLCGWQARSINKEDTPRYLNCPDSEMAKTVWPAVPPAPGKRVVIVEGVIDAIAVRKAGFNAYAVFSKKISASQMRLMKAWGIKDVVLWFDKKDALPQMIKAVEDLKMRFSNIFVPALKDWPKDLDCGDMLSNAQGSDIIRNTLDECIDVYHDLEYAQWTQGFY